MTTLVKQIKKYDDIVLLIIGYIIFERHYLNKQAVYILARQFSFLGFVTLGVCLSTICSELNLAGGSLAAFTAVCITYFSTSAFPPIAAVMLSFLIILILAFFYGFFTIKIGISPVIFSFALIYILNGIGQKLQNNFLKKPWQHFFLFPAYGKILHLPFSLFSLTVFATILILFLHFTYLGRSFFAVGTNETEAKQAGLPVNVIKMAAYVISFIAIGIGGFFFLSRTTRGDCGMANNLNWDILAALCLGHVNLNGGKGNIIEILAGCLCVTLLNSFLTIATIPFLQSRMIKGSIILLSLLCDSYRQKALRCGLN
jgi:ribose/xylose/arabinose/galactoside ABC-type transport system permease subunit